MIRGWNLARLFALCAVPALCAPAPAFAWPVDVIVDLEADAVSIRKLTALGWAESDNPAVVEAERLPSGELLLTAKGPGRALVLLYAEGKFAVWRVRVAPKGGAVKREDGTAELEAAKAACPKLEATSDSLTAHIADERCRSALLSLFQTDAYEARQLELTFEVPVLQAQLAAIDEALRPLGVDGLKLSSRGAGLVVEGTATPEQKRKALWAIFKNSVGRVPFDDRLEEPKPAPERRTP
ncbi:MAG: hypothetical protein IRZ16_09845 [Myxococcaceae bacterium]|nr:hypothetical protein [Myxococcaceae bacterium]